jgi:hypothetical protein
MYRQVNHLPPSWVKAEGSEAMQVKVPDGELELGALRNPAVWLRDN